MIDTPPRTIFYVLLDRSGSMAAMHADVIGGFNRLLADQQADGPDARMTLVQFDSQDPQEVLTDGLGIRHVRPLSERTFQPRGGTPLLDATGLLIERAEARVAQRQARGKRPEAVTFVTITDGEENQSRRFTRTAIAELVKAKEAAGWTFVFLGAGLDAYGEAGGIGYDPRSVQAFAPDGAGAQQAFDSLSTAMLSRRHKLRTGVAHDAADFFEGAKPAEADRTKRHT